MNISSAKTFLLFFSTIVIMVSCTVKRSQIHESDPIKSLSKVSDTVRIKPLQTDKSITTRTLIIYYDEKIGSQFLMDAVQEIGAELIYEYKTLKGIAVRIPEQKSVESAISYFKKIKGVSSVHRDRIYSIDPPVRSSVK